MTDQKLFEQAKKLIEQIDELTVQIDLLRADLDTVIDEVLGDLKYEIEDIRAEFEPQIQEAERRLKELKRELNALAPVVGESLEGKAVKAVLYPSRVRVKDEAALLRLAKEIPELAAAIDVRPPYYTIRRK